MRFKFFFRAGWIRAFHRIIFVSSRTKRKCTGERQSVAIAHFIRASILHIAMREGKGVCKSTSPISVRHSKCRGGVIATNTVILDGEIVRPEIETHFREIFLHTRSIDDVLTTSNAESAIGGVARLRFTFAFYHPLEWDSARALASNFTRHPRWRNINSAEALLPARHTAIYDSGKSAKMGQREVSLVKS